MKISVIVPTLGMRIEEIERLFDSLVAQTYNNFEVIVVTQDNHERITEILKKYTELNSIQIQMFEKGLSKARNKGLSVAEGEIVILSDDDCWYCEDAFENIVSIFQSNPTAYIVLTQIYDKEKNMPYKNYPKNKGYINKKLKLMSKSSIEIAYKKNQVRILGFDEKFGLGAKFVSGEEVDFLLNNFKKNSIFYEPIVTVYHPKKSSNNAEKRVVAKGALYAKNVKLVFCLMVLLRDLIVKRENNFKNFFKGYYEYIQGTN